MSEFLSLNPQGLSKVYDSHLHGERPVVTVEEKADRVEVSYIFPGITISNADQEIGGKTLPFREVGISGAGFISESGKPLLPSFGRFIQIPSGSDFEVNIIKSTPVEFQDLLITPAQEAAQDASGEGFEFDKEAYSEDTFYPEKMVAIHGPHEMDNYKVISVHIRPLQYNPAKKLLIGYGNISISIQLKPKVGAHEDVTGFDAIIDPGSNREGFGNLMLNPRRGITERITSIHSPSGIILFKPRGPEFLIIYDEKLKKPAMILAEWKIIRGLRTEVVSIDSVGNSVAEIKKYIRGRRGFLFSRLRYVLLFGDIDKIKAEEVGGNTTDHYYYTKKDPSDGSDCILPWVSGGRIPVQTAEDGVSVVNQIIRYEKKPPCDPEYYRRMTFAAYFQDDAPQDGRADRAYIKTMESIRSHLVALDFDIDLIYVSNNANPQLFKDGTPVPQEVIDAIVDPGTATDMLISDISEGQLLLGHRDHGDDDGWVDPPLQIAHIQGIRSQYPSIMYSINCRTGRFDANPSDCFAEAIMALNGGAPSLIAATEYTGTWRNDSMMKALFDAIWPGVIPTFPGDTSGYSVRFNRLGDILNYSKAYLIVSHGSNSGVKNHFEQYHVIGDPTLQLWAKNPLTLNLRTQIQRYSLYINMSSCPKDAVLTIWYMNKLLKRIEPSSPQVIIPLRDLHILPHLEPQPTRIRRSISICFSAPGFRFIQTKLKY